MLYRKLGRSGEKVSVLGFGCMRFPLNGTGPEDIDVKKAGAMIKYAVDNGVNYFDTAYVYHGGKSEPVLGEILGKGMRDKVNIATKMPVWRVKSKKDMDILINDQLKKLRTDHIDFYLLHGLQSSFWKNARKAGALEFLDRALKDGRIRHAGFSFHDKTGLFKEIVDACDWSFCQIQYNYMDEDFQAGTEGLKYAASKGLGVVIMEPLKGGGLTRCVPPEVKKIWDTADVRRSPAEWALRFIWDRPEVSVVLSGMSTMEQVAENIRVAKEAMPNSLSDKEKLLIAQAGKAYRQRIMVDCTGCGYCMPCPSGVNIPENFRVYNDASMYGDEEAARLSYYIYIGPGQKASLCQDCGECEDKCPQKIRIREKLKEAAGKLDY